MSTDARPVRALALEAYERGRRKTALVRALVVAIATGGLSALVRGPTSLVFVPLVFAVVLVTEWRGKLLGQGMRRGTVLGLASWLLPMTMLRPCCANMDPTAMAGACCTMPGCCLAAGACLGLVIALFAPLPKRGPADLSGAVGLGAGALGVTALRCSGLFAGEALGLLSGIALASALVSGARHALARAN